MTKPHDNRAATEELISEATDEVRQRRKRVADLESSRAAATPPRQRVSLAALIVAAPILLALLVFSFTAVSLASLFEPRPEGPVAYQQAQQTLDDLVVAIEAFRDDYHELPEALIEVGIPERGAWSYAVIGNGHYRVEGTLYGQRVVFDSTRAPARALKDEP